MKKIFIYYSLNGSGDKVASILMTKGIDIRKVIADYKVSKSNFSMIMKGGFLAGINYKAKLIDFNDDVNSYDEVIIGSPIWNNRFSCPINTVLSQLDLTGKKLTFILYSASGKENKAVKKINKLYPDAEIINLKEPKELESIPELDNI